MVIDVVCVWVGDKYPQEYVENLYYGVQRNLDVPFRFHVITEHHIDTIPVNIIPLPNLPVDLMGHKKAWWYKMWMFAPVHNFNQVLYLDLDVVIVNDLTKFTTFAPNKFCICQDFNRQYIKNYHVSNSSVMAFTASDWYQLWTSWAQNPEHHISRFRGDQDYITDWFTSAPNSVFKQWWPRNWAMSWKWEIEHGGKRNNGTDRTSYYEPDRDFVLPEDCSIVVCHGEPNPSEIHTKIRRHWHGR